MWHISWFGFVKFFRVSVGKCSSIIKGLTRTSKLWRTIGGYFVRFLYFEPHVTLSRIMCAQINNKITPRFSRPDVFVKNRLKFCIL